MKDFDKPYRLSIFNALNNQISKPVYEEVKKIDASAEVFVILGTQRSVPSPEADTLWARRCSIDIIITHKSGVSVSKDDIDSVAEEILELLMPDYETFNVAVPSLFQFANPSFETGTTQPIQLITTEIVIAKVITISINIIQQS